jgi:hypothetical protein
MSAGLQPRVKDHWSVRLRVKRPGPVNRTVLIVLAVVQTLLMVVTASSLATGGGLYGCSSACGTAAVPTTPALAVLLGILMLLLPVVIGALCETWPGALALAALPWLPAIIIGANSMLAPLASVVAAPAGSPSGAPPVSKFGPPFWLDPNHLPILLFSLALFMLLGWLGWVGGQALKEA